MLHGGMDKRVLMNYSTVWLHRRPEEYPEASGVLLAPLQ